MRAFTTMRAAYLGSADQKWRLCERPRRRQPKLPWRADSAITRAGMREALPDMASCVVDMPLNSVRAGVSKFEKQQRQEDSWWFCVGDIVQITCP
jgi:hypothetical protein